MLKKRPSYIPPKKSRKRGQRGPARKPFPLRPVVLNNPNAIEVSGLPDLSPEHLRSGRNQEVALAASQGQVLGLNDSTVRTLTALQAFRPKQAWNQFRRPATLVRLETVKLAEDIAGIGRYDKSVARKVVFGERGSGKSVLLLQAQAMASVNGWVVVHIPEGRDLIHGNTAYEPLSGPDGVTYVQPESTAQLLGNIALANHTLLSTIALRKQHRLPIVVRPDTSLAEFAMMGAEDPPVAWSVWEAFWSELRMPSDGRQELARPPVMYSMDGMNHVMGMSHYLDPNVKPIHAHKLALVRHFASMLGGKLSLPNGGAVVAATSASGTCVAATMEHCLEAAFARQQGRVAPVWDPWAAKDESVERSLEGVQVIKSQGLSKAEARGLMEYYARNGVLRATVTDQLVGEAWTLAGSGIIGALEKGVVRLRF